MKNNILVFMLLFVVGLCAYASSFSNPFLMDDHVFFNRQKSDLKFFVSRFFPDKTLTDDKTIFKASYYRPMAHLLPLGCHNIFGRNPVGYHVFNLVLFSVAAWLVYIFLMAVFNHFWLALVSAIFYLVHPINGYVVNYITASVYAAQAIFMIASLYHLHPRGGGGRWLWSFFFFILALMCHETSMVLPLYAIALLVIVGRNKMSEAIRQTRGLWLTLFAYLVFRFFFINLGSTVGENFTLLNLNVFEYLASLTKLITWYLTRLVFPDGIVLMWLTPAVRGGAALVWLAVAAGWITVLLLALRYFKSNTALRLGLIWLALGFLPLSLGALISPLQGVTIEPHWFVFSSIGFFFALASIFTGMFRSNKKLAVSGFIILVIFWMVTAWRYNLLWSNEKSYCHYWIKQSPQFKMPTFFLAQVYERERNFPMARYYYQQNILNRYKDWKVFASLGRVEAADKNLTLAEDYFLRALNIEPNSTYLLNLLASLKYRMGDQKAAIDIYERSLTITPQNEITMVALIQIYIKLNDNENVIRLARHMMRFGRDPQLLKNARILLNLRHPGGGGG